ncbi:MAG TPA: GNAT family N-acetyltransferase [Bacteroidia bacterium]|nr:GNAT family N-acetyltransferase [Bacteroidia bacterium]
MIVELDQYLWDMDGPALQGYYKKLNVIEKNDTVIVAYLNGKPVGCGCFKPYDKTRAEIKRMYVKPEARGNRIGYGILHALEVWATELGYKSTVLETGHKQVEAIELYKKSGYAIIENYGPYAGIENSLCFEKKLS